MNKLRAASLVLTYGLLVASGCSRSDEADLLKARSEADAAKAKLDKAEQELASLKAALLKPQAQDADRKAAEWIVRLGGYVRIVSAGVALEYPKNGKLPDGPFQVVDIDLTQPANENKVTNDGIVMLRGLKHLKSLCLEVKGFDDLSPLQEMENLEVFRGRFYKDNSTVTESLLSPLQKLPRLRELSIAYVPEAAIASLHEFAHLEVLQLLQCPLPDAAIDTLNGLKHLRVLSFQGTPVSDAGLERLRDLPELTTLSLEGTTVKGANLEVLKALPKLISLNISDTQVTDSTLSSLRKLPRLQTLTLCYQRDKITDAGLKQLAEMPKLMLVSVEQTNVSDQAIEELRSALPQCRITKEWAGTR
jgi:Leucine-rich repeat (LRR) protein